jgi:hypothetical protein
MKPIDVPYTLQRIFETNPSLSDVFRSNLRILKQFNLPSLLVLPDDLIYRFQQIPTLYFATPFNVGMNVWKADACQLVFRSTYAVGLIHSLTDLRAAENTMFNSDEKRMHGCFEIAGHTSWSGDRGSTFRIWPDTFEHTKVFGQEAEAKQYVEAVRAYKLSNR